MDMTPTADALREDRTMDGPGAPGPLTFELPTQRWAPLTGPPTQYGTPNPGVPARRRTPAPAIGDAVYCLLSFVPAIVFFVLTVTLCAVGLGLSLIWIGVPVLALALLTARLGAYLQLAMCAALLNSPMPDPGPPPRRRGRSMGVLAALIRDAANWRAAAYWLLKIALAPIQFGVVVGLYSFAFGGISYPLWRGWLPPELAADGSWHRGAEFGRDYFIDSWPQMLIPTVAGLLMLALAPAIVRVLVLIDRELVRGLLAGPGR